jgi:putative ABC transport system permease protein
MLKNYFLIAWRNLWKNKTFSLINISGLALGLAVFTLIMLWVNNERSYNGFHKDKDRIAMAMVNKATSASEVKTFPACPTLLAPSMKKDLPAAEYVSRCSWGDVRLFSYNDKVLSETGLYVDPDFLKIFSFPLVKGNDDNVLRQPNTVLISESLAEKYFGNEDPVGKIITVEQSQQYKIEGVLKDVPANSTIRFDFLMPMGDYVKQTMNGEENWESNNVRTYVKLKEGTSTGKLNASIKNFMQRYTDEQDKTGLFLWSLENWYLRNDFKAGVYAGGGRITYVKLFIVIAVFILLLACINFMNLSTARATQRAKEVGVRKTIGAGRRSLIFQFISESVLLSVLAGLIALLMVYAVLPVFNTFLQKQISIDFYNPSTILFYTGIILLTGLLAGSYPALVLSSFRPVKVLKNVVDKTSGSSVWIRKALVVVQFAISVMLIIGTIVVYKQVNFIENKNLGYNKENLLWFPNNIAAGKNEAAISEFEKVPGVVSVARATSTFTTNNNRGGDVKWPGKKEGEDIFFSYITGDQNIIQTMGIEMKEGRAFSKDFATDTAAFILNEEAAKQMGLKDPVGQTIETYGGKGTIVGVAKDFHIESMHTAVAPIIMECRPDWTWLYYVRTDGKNVQQTISGLADVYKRMAPGYLFDYTFQDKQYEQLYRSEQQIGTLVNWFAFFAIFISCLGLLGLTIFSVERKTKEIGIRKILGASVADIVSLVSKQFLTLVLLSIAIAIAPSWYFMNNWLQDYTYRIDMGWWMVAIAAGISLLIAFLTISVQAVKAALVNPVKNLRTE